MDKYYGHSLCVVMATAGAPRPGRMKPVAKLGSFIIHTIKVFVPVVLEEGTNKR